MALTTSLCLMAASTAAWSVRLLVGVGHRRRILLHLGRPVDLVGGRRRELDVDLLRDRAGLGDLGGEARDAADLVFGHDRAARESPDAAVNHAHAEAGRDRGVPSGSLGGPAPPPRPPKPPPPPPRPPPRPPPPPPNPPASGCARRVTGARRRALTPGSVIVRVKRMSAYEQPAVFASASAMSARPLNFDCSGVALRRLREQIADQIARGEQRWPSRRGP